LRGDTVAVPPSTDPGIVAAAVRGLTRARVIVSAGRFLSRRAEAQARPLVVWRLSDNEGDTASPPDRD
jgi:hypothetical protein